MRRLVGVVLVVMSMTAGCAVDPPSAMVGVQVAGCDPGTEYGSGVFVTVDGSATPLVLTSAHVVKGARSITVVRDDRSVPAEIVAFDPEMDLAYLAADGLTTSRPATVDSDPVDGGEQATAYVVRGGEVVALPVVVRRRIQIRTEDIYIDGETLRPGYELGVDIDAGDSGAAVVVGGRVIGIVWARSRQDTTRSYAVDPDRAGGRIARQLATGDLGDVDLARCS